MDSLNVKLPPPYPYLLRRAPILAAPLAVVLAHPGVVGRCPRPTTRRP